MQTSANGGPGSSFVLEAIIKALISKSNSSQVIKLMDQGRLFLNNDTRSSYSPKFAFMEWSSIQMADNVVG